MGSQAQSDIEQVPSRDVWPRLVSNASAQVVDVRTRAEWAFVGVPDLSSIGRDCVRIEWQTFPDSRVNPAFADQLAAALASVGASRDNEIFFLCRSGGRSQLAAQTMASAGYDRCRNVSDGFEGPLDPSRHRGTVAGWKSAGLPWVQG